jgi:hypothetical protein
MEAQWLVIICETFSSSQSLLDPHQASPQYRRIRVVFTSVQQRLGDYLDEHLLHPRKSLAVLHHQCPSFMPISWRDPEYNL